MASFTDHNAAAWNALAEGEAETDHHRDLARFMGTGSSLRSIEMDEIADVTGKTLLHIPCNMGADTLSWARRGAVVTGVDLAERAIDRARAVAEMTGTPARFVAADLYALPDLGGPFDLVVATYGVLWWMSDLPRWARIMADQIKPGATFHLIDMHPTTNCLTVMDDAPLRFGVTAPYAHPTVPLQVLHNESSPAVYTWTYGLGEVLSALVAAGLRLRFVHEHMMTFYQQFPVLVQGDDGWWRWPSGMMGLPLLFSLAATKPAQ